MSAFWSGIAWFVLVVAVTTLGAALGVRAAPILVSHTPPWVARLLRTLSRLLDRIAGRRIPERTPPEPEWQLSLLIDADDEADVLHSSVFVRGPCLPEWAIVHLDAWIHLDVVDDRGRVRLRTDSIVRRDGLNADVDLDALAVPDGECVEDVAHWDWKVVLSDSLGEIASRRGPLFVADHLNIEAEIETADQPGF
jgi:hypothetical protein